MTRKQLASGATGTARLQTRTHTMMASLIERGGRRAGRRASRRRASRERRTRAGRRRARRPRRFAGRRYDPSAARRRASSLAPSARHRTLAAHKPSTAHVTPARLFWPTRDLDAAARPLGSIRHRRTTERFPTQAHMPAFACGPSCRRPPECCPARRRSRAPPRRKATA